MSIHTGEVALQALLERQMSEAGPQKYDGSFLRSFGYAVLRTEASPYVSVYEKTAELAERAELTLHLLDEQLGTSEASFMHDMEHFTNQEVRESRIQLIEEAKVGAHSKSTPGLELDRKWAYDIATALVENKPITVWGDNVLPTIRDINRPTRGSTVRPPDFQPTWDTQEEAAYRVMRMLYAINPEQNTRLRFMVPSPIFGLAGVDSLAFRTDFSQRFLEQEGLFQPDLPFTDIDIVRPDDYVQHAKDLVDLLSEASGAGEVVDRWGQRVFVPATWLREWTMLQRSDSEEIDYIALGNVSCFGEGTRMYGGNALLAATLARAGADQAINITVGSTQRMLVGGLLRAMHITDRSAYHSIGVRGHLMGAKFRAFQIGHMLRNELLRYRESISHITSFDDLNAEAYADKNYLHVMEQDKEVVRVQLTREAAVMEDLGIDLRHPETLLKDYEAAHICIGTNMYPVMLRERLSSGIILGVDVASSTYDYMQDVKAGRHDEVWLQHEAEIVAAAHELHMPSDAFRGSFRSAAEKLQVVLDDARQLPKRSFRHVQMHFGAEATGLGRSNFYAMMHSIAEAMQDGGVFEGVFTMNSAAWSDGVNTLPAVAMTEDDYRLALLDAGFDIVDSEVIGEELAGEVKVRPDENFIYFRCRVRSEGRPVNQ